MPEIGWIPAAWPAPSSVQAGVTTRSGGVSLPPFDSFNLAQHVDDDPVAVQQNRQRLRQVLRLPAEPMWLNQVHGIDVCTEGVPCDAADACVHHGPGQVCVVMTADCLPVLLCDRGGSVVAAAHAGWRGLASGVIAQTVGRMQVTPAEVMVWLGPAIGARAFEVGEDVRAVFLGLGTEYANVFRPHMQGKWMMDIYAAARLQLAALGVHQVFGGDYCTFEDHQRFYSYRRDGRTGRMASLIWIIPA